MMHPAPSKLPAVMMAALAISIAAAPIPFLAQPARAITVFDPSNYAQNILTAARTLRQVNQQIQQLQNEAQMLVSMGKNLSRIDFPELAALRDKLGAIDRLMSEAQGINFKVADLDQRFARLFPQDFAAALRTDQRVRNARERLDGGVESFRHSMAVQARVVENIKDDSLALGQIIERSQVAEGSLQAAQATNQILALATKQQMQLQQMMAAHFRSNAQEQARRATQALEARAATKKFLGSGSAYTPQ